LKAPEQDQVISELRDSRVYLSAERTFLSWIRTGLALMGLGFVVARFGLFLRELAAVRPMREPPSDFSTWAGSGLVALGVALTIGATLRHIRLLERLDSGEILRRPSRMGIALAAVIAAGGCVLLVLIVIGSGNTSGY
jgi:putative membrane protein